MKRVLFQLIGAVLASLAHGPLLLTTCSPPSGTAAQLAIAIMLSFTFFALHMKTWPYKARFS